MFHIVQVIQTHCTGDEQGKGENNGSIGSSTDIKTRETLLAKNKFTPNKEYNDSTA